MNLRRVQPWTLVTRTTVGVALLALAATTVTPTLVTTTDPSAAPETATALELAAASPSADRLVAREAEAVVLTGSDVPTWSGLSAFGLAAPFPAGGGADNPLADQIRSAHHGTLVAPPATVNVNVDEIAAYRWDGLGWQEIAVQVDEKFPHFLANGRSDFGFYSGVDEELTYAWNSGAHSIGEEAWKKVAGECVARYPESVAEVTALTRGPLNPNGPITLGQGETAADYLAAKVDPVAGLDNDDEIAFLADDAGDQAPQQQVGPSASRAGDRQEVTLVDPITGLTKYVYLVLQDGGSTFNYSNGYVDHVRDDTADWFADRGSWSNDDPEKLGTSNTGYGANLGGTACVEAQGTDYTLGAPRLSNDRFPLDGMTITTDDYEFGASGRWMQRSMRVTAPGTKRDFGLDLIDRWKGRAFQQSPDSQISVVGFEDEQVNWEANASLLGWRSGPIRTIRELWGADSGTNVTNTETFYPSAMEHRYRVRVHPIPSDGLYTSWDYNGDVAACYFDAILAVAGDQDGECAGGVKIDGIDDEQFGNIDGLPAPLDCNFEFPPSGDGCEAFIDIPDPTTTLPTAVERWEQVAGTGDNGSLVYVFEFKGATSAANASAVPYYRDDACLDDGTGDGPTPRPFPGQNSSHPTVYGDVPCDHSPGGNSQQRQGAYGSHGLHFFITGDSDNVFGPKPVTEIDGSQWIFAEPTRTPRPVGEPFAQVIRVPLVPTVLPQTNLAGVSTGKLRGGVAAVDASWHIGASAGQYAGEGPGSFSDTSAGGVDSGVHSTTSLPTYGQESRNWFRAMVLEDGDGRRWAQVSNDFYLPQDILNRRVAGILADRDSTAGLLGGTVTGIGESNLTVSVSHSHSSPFYSSTAPGVFAFQDVFDIRFFEWAAQRMADAVTQAVDGMTDVRLGAAQIDVTTTKRNPEGPNLGFDGEPAAYSSAATDAVMSVVRLDDVSGAEPKLMANWFIWGRHPEDVSGNNLHTGEWVNAAHRILDRELDAVNLFSQSDTGGSEIAKSANVHQPEARQEFDHKEYNQVDRVARQVADRVKIASEDIARAADGLDPIGAERVVAPRTDLSIGVRDLRVAPPSYRPAPTVSNCRTEESYDGTPGIPAAGLPDCLDILGEFQDTTGIPLADGSEAIFGQLPIGATIQQLVDAGIPVPDNYGAPSYTAVQESLLVHLQAIRLGDIAITVCPCEMFTDTGRNIRSRINDVPDDFWYGWDWNANYEYHPDFQEGIAYDGLDTNGDGTFDDGHGPLTLPDASGQHFCVQSDTDQSWTCRNPRNQAETLAPISNAVFVRWKARIYNDALGWDDLLGEDIANPNSFESESEPSDPTKIFGNWTHEELDGDMDGGGYKIVIPVSMSNDYFGYQPPYSEFQNRDYYRKALSGLGPHSTDFMALRLTRMAATLKGASNSLVDEKITAKDLFYQSFEDDSARTRAATIGQVATAYLPGYEATLPADGGTGGAILAQPADIQRFDAASMSFVGGSNYTDVPEVAVERCITQPCTSDAHFVPFGDGWGETQLLPDFPDPGPELAQQQAGQFVWKWHATFEAYSSDQDEPDLTGEVREQVPAGTYRFQVRGCHRGLPGSGPTPPDPTDYCGAHDLTGRVAEYTATSDNFTVSPWTGITVDDLALADGSVSFRTGPDFRYPTDQSNMELTTFASSAGDIQNVVVDTTIGRVTHAGRDVVDYPNSYDSPIDFIATRNDDDCLGGGCEDLVNYGGGRQELFCFDCTFQTWADTGVVETAVVSVRRSPSGDVDTFPATWDNAAGRWVASITALYPGDAVYVDDGAILDNFGETNLASPEIVVPPAVVSITGATVTEGNSGTVDAIAQLTLSRISDDPVTVELLSSDGTATAGEDYIDLDGTFVIPPFATSLDVPVSILGDTTLEPDETLSLTILSATGAVVGASAATVTILNDDEFVPPSPRLDIGDAEVREGDTGTRDLVFTVSLSDPVVGDDAVIDIDVTHLTADEDDVTITSPVQVTILQNSRFATVRVPVIGDLIDEDDETIRLEVTSVDSTATILVGDDIAIGTILDDDAAPAIRVNDAQAVEGTDNLVFTVTLSNPSENPVRVSHLANSGTATLDEDFSPSSGTLVFAPGELSQPVTVTVLDDALDENRETMTLVLDGAVASTVGDPIGLGTIIDDDPFPTLVIGDRSEFEGDDGTTAFGFEVGLSPVSGRAVTVDWRTVNDEAAAPGDFTAVASSLQIPAGATSQIVTVAVNGDTEVEPDERFDVRLSNPVSATISDERGRGCIIDDDGGDSDICLPDASPSPTDSETTGTPTDSETTGTPTDGGTTTPPSPTEPGPTPTVPLPTPTSSTSSSPSPRPEPSRSPAPQATGSASDPSVRRLAGENRYLTAITMSRDRFPLAGSARSVVLARGDEPNGFADALAGAPLAIRLDAPLLITDPGTLVDDVMQEIVRVLASDGTVYILGGPLAINPSVEQTLRDAGMTTTRIAGASRVETAAQIALRLGNPDTVFIASGDTFADALPASAAAVEVGGAVLLARNGQRHPTTDAWLAANNPSTVYAVGGPAAAAYPEAIPLAGQDRLTTAIAVATEIFTAPPTIGIARSDRFPDALTGGAHSGGNGGPVLLTNPSALSDVTRDAICGFRASVNEIFLYGGPIALATTFEDSTRAALDGRSCGGTASATRQRN